MPPHPPLTLRHKIPLWLDFITIYKSDQPFKKPTRKSFSSLFDEALHPDWQRWLLESDYSPPPLFNTVGSREKQAKTQSKLNARHSTLPSEIVRTSESCPCGFEETEEGRRRNRQDGGDGQGEEIATVSVNNEPYIRPILHISVMHLRLHFLFPLTR